MFFFSTAFYNIFSTAFSFSKIMVFFSLLLHRQIYMGLYDTTPFFIFDVTVYCALFSVLLYGSKQFSERHTTSLFSMFF